MTRLRRQSGDAHMAIAESDMNYFCNGVRRIEPDPERFNDDTDHCDSVGTERNPELFKCGLCKEYHCESCISKMDAQWKEARPESDKAVRCGDCDEFNCTMCLLENSPDDCDMVKCFTHAALFFCTRYFCKGCVEFCGVCENNFCYDCYNPHFDCCSEQFCSNDCYWVHKKDFCDANSDREA